MPPSPSEMTVYNLQKTVISLKYLLKSKKKNFSAEYSWIQFKLNCYKIVIL